MNSEARDAAARRRDAFAQAGQSGAPNGGERARAVPFGAQLRAQLVERDGKSLYELLGYASVTGRAYEMWDMWGPYDEEIERGAFEATLAARPDVAFLVNHRGVTMARTTNGSLVLTEDALGLRSQAWLNPDRQDVRDLISAIDDELITEMSFAFMLDEGHWNDALDKFTITKVTIDRGDVSAVNYGANPYTSIAARSREIMADLERLPVGLARAAMARLSSRVDISTVSTTPTSQSDDAPVGMPMSQVDAWLARIEAR